MRRTVVAIAVLAAIAAAYGLYAISTATRRLEQDVTALERQRDRLASDIAVLAAERAYLTRPERIEPIARLNGLGPLEPAQFRTRDALEGRASQ